MNLAVIITCPIIILIQIVVSVYLFAYYTHTDEKPFREAIVYKICIILGITILWMQLLIMPLDVENANENIGIDMFLQWEIVFGLNIGLVLAFLPVLLFFYESDHDMSFLGRVWNTLIVYQLYIVSLFVQFVIWYFAGNVYGITYTMSKESFTFACYSETTTNCTPADNFVLTQDFTFSIYANFYDVMIATMNIIGWILVVAYLGNGLINYPFRNIRNFVIRPKSVTTSYLKSKERIIKGRITDQLFFTKDLKDQKENLVLVKGWWAKRKAKTSLTTNNKLLQRELVRLEEEVNLHEVEKKLFDYNPLIPYLKLILGVLGGILSILVFLNVLLGHMITYSDGTGVFGILDEMQYGITYSWGGPCGTIFYTIVIIYLEICLLEGIMNIGLKLCTFVNIHPIRLDGTWMNSFLVNLQLAMISSLALLNFIVRYQPKFTNGTTASFYFNYQMNNTNGLEWFYYGITLDLFFFCWGIISFVLQLLRPYFRCMKCCRDDDESIGIKKDLRDREKAMDKLNDGGEFELKNYASEKKKSKKKKVVKKKRHHKHEDKSDIDEEDSKRSRSKRKRRSKSRHDKED